MNAALRDRQWVAVPLAIGFAALAWLLTRRTLGGSTTLLAVALAVPAVLVLLVRTRELALVWLVLVASIFPARLVPLSIAGVRTDLPELLAFGLVGAVALRGALGEPMRRSAFLGPLSALVLAAVSGVVVAVSHGDGRSVWLALFKGFLLLLVPLALCALFASQEHRDLLERWVHGICTYGGLLTLVAAATGQSVPQGEAPEVVTLGVVTQGLRLRPALLTLTVLATLLLAARVMSYGARRSDVARFAVYGAVVAVSFTRSTWVPLALSLVLLAILRPGRRVPLRGLKVLVAGVMVSSTLFVLSDSGALGSTPQAIALRVQSIGSDRVLEENSYQDRANEVTFARQALAHSPVLGVGMGRPYGAVRRVYDPVSGARSYQPRRFIHNSFLGFWLWAGLAGVLALLWFSARIVRVSVRAARTLPPEEGTRAVAAGLALLALGVQASFQTSLTSRPVFATIAVALTLLDVPTQLRGGGLRP